MRIKLPLQINWWNNNCSFSCSLFISSPELKWKLALCKLMQADDLLEAVLNEFEIVFCLDSGYSISLSSVLLSPGVSALHQPMAQMSSCRSGTRQETTQTQSHGAASVFRWGNHTGTSGVIGSNYTHCHEHECSSCSYFCHANGYD